MQEGRIFILPWWMGNPIAVLVFFVVCLVVCLFLLRSLRGRPHRDWQTIDMIVVLAGGLGLLALVFQAQFTASQAMAPFYDIWLRHQRSIMTLPLHDGEGVYCEPHPRTPTSPLNNEEIEADRSAICSWVRTQFKPVASRIISGENARFEPTQWSKFPDTKNVPVAVIGQHGEIFAQAARDWNDALSKVEETKRQPYENDLYLLLIMLSPFALSIAFSFQLVKIYYEDRG